MKKHALILILLLSLTAVFSQSDKRLKGLEKELNQILTTTKSPGFAVAIVEGDKILYSKGFGYRDVEQKLPVDGNTLFAIGSSTKAFTSAILGQLENEKKLSLDDSPRQYVPELSFYNNEMDNTIIIEDLMSHRTGLPRHDYSWYLFPEASKDSLLQRVKYHEPFTGIREQWYYNNFMFLAQGVIAEKITNKSWEQNIEERFFKPLNMSRSKTTIQGMKTASNASLGYYLDDDGKAVKMEYYDISGMSPAGSINSSVNDMSNWLMTWINKGKFKDQDILPEAYVDEAISSHMVVSSGLPGEKNPDIHLSNYGFGWFLSSYKGHYRVEHGGNIDGFSANVAFFPSDKIGIVVLSNENGSSVPNLVRNTVADYILEEKKSNWIKTYQEAIEKAEKAKKESEDDDTISSTNNVKDTTPSHPLKDYTGNYSNKGYGNFDLEMKNDSLFANFKIKKFYVKHFHYDVFQPFEITEKGIDTTEGSGGLFLNFTTNDVGDISVVKMKIEPTLDAIEFKRTPKTIEVNESDLEQYTGEYDLMGQTVKVYTKNDSTLYVFLPGQPEYELVALEKDLFGLKVIEGYKVKFEASKGKTIDFLTFVQPNGNFKAKRKE